MQMRAMSQPHVAAFDAEIAKTEAPAKSAVTENTIFTEDAAEKARTILTAKLTQLNRGIDPKIMQAGITLAGYHIGKGARTFAAYVYVYAKAMAEDLGELKRAGSWKSAFRRWPSP